MKTVILVFTFLMFFISCRNKNQKVQDSQDQTKDSIKAENFQPGTFGYDVEFLKKKQKVIVLSDSTQKAMILVSADYQGRVMTSTAGGYQGKSFGWLNYKAIESDSLQPHINVFGGEDRIWLGPEGGQFSIFFKKGDAFEFKNWQTPKEIDSEPFETLTTTSEKAMFLKHLKLTNYSGTDFEFDINRNVSLIDKKQTENILDIQLNDNIMSVGIETENMITNTGKNTWDKKKGALSIWILCMFNPTDSTTIVVPYKEGDEKKLGRIVNDEYFGKIPQEWLQIEEKVVFLKADGKRRCKIGLSPKRTKAIAGSYDALNKVLTIAQFSFDEKVADYVNSMWKIQDKPFEGDVVNSYNDGPLADGSQLGPFYEIESSSPAAFLKPGEKIVHYHRTFHFTGLEKDLNQISEKVLGIELEKVKGAFLSGKGK